MPPLAVEPNNVLFDADDRPLLTDFDMALATGKIIDTCASQVAPAVDVAPECLSDHPEARVQTNVYGLAMVILYMDAGASRTATRRRSGRAGARSRCCSRRGSPASRCACAR